MSFFNKLKHGLTKTKKGMVERLEETFLYYAKVDEELFSELEEIMITSDIGVDTTLWIMDELREKARRDRLINTMHVKAELINIITELLDKGDAHKLCEETPLVILVIGVNGVGKTTSIAKIASNLKNEGKSVMVAAADTFRAAAISQIEIWCERVGVSVIKHKEGSDPSAVIFDAIQSAKAKKTDVLICDTAGRLHNKKNLMNELEKMYRIIEREFPEASKETLLVLDAGTGQNAVVQAKEFSSITEITGIVLTKLDGTAKGGVIIGISSALSIPVKYIGVGEGVEDLQHFEPKEFAEALFSR